MSEKTQDVLLLQRNALYVEPSDTERSLGYLSEALNISLNAIRDCHTREVFNDWYAILTAIKHAEFDTLTRQRRKTAA